MSTIHILTGKDYLEANITTKVQSVPFKIHADCDAKMKLYFEKYVHSKDGCLRGSFRGYPLKGKKIDLPQGYKGIVLHESSRPKTDEEERSFYLVNVFDQLTFWNWDKNPSQNDAFIQALDWIEVAEALHAPILED